MNITQPYLQVGGWYLQIYKYFHHYKDEIRQLCTFRPSIVNHVHMYAKQFFKYTFSNFSLCTVFQTLLFQKFRSCGAVLFKRQDLNNNRNYKRHVLPLVPVKKVFFEN
jgi:hypothetical protein